MPALSPVRLLSQRLAPLSLFVLRRSITGSPNAAKILDFLVTSLFTKLDWPNRPNVTSPDRQRVLRRAERAGGDTDWPLTCKVKIVGCQDVTKGIGVRRPYLSPLRGSITTWKTNKEKL